MKIHDGTTLAEKAIIVLCVLIAFIVWGGECRAEERTSDYLTILPVSKHHNTDTDHNEEHHGVGWMRKYDSTGRYWGVLAYKNSYGRWGPAVYSGLEQTDCTVCFGGFAGVAPMYMKDDHLPFVGAFTVRYKWLTVMSLPSVLTAVSITIPLGQ